MSLKDLRHQWNIIHSQFDFILYNSSNFHWWCNALDEIKFKAVKVIKSFMLVMKYNSFTILVSSINIHPNFIDENLWTMICEFVLDQW
jgi:hypothetical protein